MSNGTLSSNTPVIRLCHIIQWKHFDGYGFNLHADKTKPGQYIGKVDEGSPAEAAGLKQGDRIIEVNGVNISNENHKQVVQRIKAVPNETKLLVVDAEADKYFKAKNVVIKSTLPEVVYLKTPVDADGENNMNGDKADGNDDTNSQKSAGNATVTDSENQGDKIPLQSNGSSMPPAGQKIESEGDMGNNTEILVDSTCEILTSVESSNESSEATMEFNNTNSNNNSTTTTTMATTTIITTTTTTTSSSNNSSLNLNMTAKELRAQLASRKKYDPKKESMDFKKKFDIVQKL